MNGLLNYQPDPIAMGLLGFASGALTPVSRGGGFGAGLLGASQGMSQARQEAMQIEQMRQQQMMQDLQRRKMESELQMAPAHAQLYQAQAKAAELNARKAEEEMAQAARLRAALEKIHGGGAPMGGSIMAGAAQAPQQTQTLGARPGRMDQYKRLMTTADAYEQNGLFEQANKMRETATKTLPEISKTMQITNEQGKLVTRTLFKDGSYEDTDAAEFDPNKAFNVQRGQVNPNLPLQQYERGKAAAGATRINIPINTEKTYYGNVAEGLAKQDIAAIEAAKGAPQQIERAKRIIDTLGQNPITGTLAEQRLMLNKALATAGVVDPNQAAATEALQSDLAKLTLGAIRSSNLGAGQGFTDKDRLFLEQAESGRIDMTPQNLRRVAQLADSVARATYSRGQEVAGRLKGRQGMGDVTDALRLPELPSAAPTPTGIPSMSDIDAEIARRRRGR